MTQASEKRLWTMITRRWLRVVGFVFTGLLVGAGLGLYLGWVAWPTEFTDANPAILQGSYQQDYIVMVATAYAVDGDLDAARTRINGLGETGSDTLFALTLDTIIQQPDEKQKIRYLVHLANDLGLRSPAIEPFLDSPSAEPDDGA